MSKEYNLKNKEDVEKLYSKVENRRDELYKKLKQLERIERNMIVVPVLLNAIIMPLGIKVLGINSILSSLVAASPLIAVEVGILLLVENKIANKKIPAIKEEIEAAEEELSALYELKELYKELEILNQKEMTPAKARLITGKAIDSVKGAWDPFRISSPRYLTTEADYNLESKLLNTQSGYKGSRQYVKKMNMVKEENKKL